MAGTSAIQWTEATWNPTTGCDRISSGCDNCYALRMAGRLKRMGQPRYQLDGDPRTSGPGFAVQTHPDLLATPLHWTKPRLIFVNSMSDLFHARVGLGFLQQVFDVMATTPQHTYQILTKRSRRLARLAPQLPWPPNVWMGVSVESADHVERVADLEGVPAAVRFISAEPLLGPVTLPLDGIDWVIAGGESGAGFRPVDPDWVRSLRDQCVNHPGTAFYFKQFGGRNPKSGGRMLDGREWTDMPARSQRATPPTAVVTTVENGRPNTSAKPRSDGAAADDGSSGVGRGIYPGRATTTAITRAAGDR